VLVCVELSVIGVFFFWLPIVSIIDMLHWSSIFLFELLFSSRLRRL
jgi:hypothetical protein